MCQAFQSQPAAQLAGLGLPTAGAQWAEQGCRVAMSGKLTPEHERRAAGSLAAAAASCNCFSLRCARTHVYEARMCVS